VDQENASRNMAYHDPSWRGVITSNTHLNNIHRCAARGLMCCCFFRFFFLEAKSFTDLLLLQVGRTNGGRRVLLLPHIYCTWWVVAFRVLDISCPLPNKHDCFHFDLNRLCIFQTGRKLTEIRCPFYRVFFIYIFFLDFEIFSV